MAEPTPPQTNGAKPPIVNRSVRDTILAELAKPEAEREPKAAATDSEPAKEAPAVEESTEEADPAAPEPVDPEPEAEPAEPPPAEPTTKADPEQVKRLAAVQKAESIARKRIAAEREQLARDKAEHAEGLRVFGEFQKLAARAKYNPAEALRALGLSDDDMELAARQLYSRSKAAQADPKHRETTDRLMRERELQDEVADLKKWRTERETTERKAADDARAQREAERYIGTVEKAIDEAHPLAAVLVAKNASKARARFIEIALDLSEESGETPSPSDVLAEFETRRKAELEELGIDPATVIKAKPKAAAVADKKPQPKPQSGATKTAAAKAATKADILRELEAGDFSDS